MEEVTSTPPQAASGAPGIDSVLDRKQKNTLPLYGNKETMNLNSMILTNVQGSPYFKEDLYQFKTFHEVVDEIYFKVEHLEPWEKNSRKLAGQVGMCGGVRGVAAGGIVSTAFCLLYKLFTLKLTRRQVTSLLHHHDSPYIRGLGFLYIRYCQPPADFWDWMGPFIDDEEEIDLKAGGGYQVTVGEMVRMILSKLEWFGTLFPRMPLTVQKQLEEHIKQVKMAARPSQYQQPVQSVEDKENGSVPKDEWGEAERRARRDEGRREREKRSRSRSPRRRSRERRRDSRERRERLPERRPRSKERSQRSRSRERRQRSQDRRAERERERKRSRSRERRGRSRDRSRERRGRERSREKRSRSRGRDKDRSRSRERRRERSRSRNRRSGSRERAADRARSRSRERTHR